MNSAVHTWGPNQIGRDFVVGDIHGHFYVLERLLEHLGFDTRADRLFSVGDLIDRGRDSHRAAEFIDKPWFHAIRGNHEQMMCDASLPYTRAHDAQELWRINGGDWFERVGAGDQSWLLDAVLSLPLAIEVDLLEGGYAAIVHANVYGDDWRSMQEALDETYDENIHHAALWSRERAHSVQDRLKGDRQVDRIEVAGPSVVFFGHTPMAVPLACDNTRWIDTGVFMPRGHLTVAELAVDGHVWSLSVRRDKPYSGWRVLASASDDGVARLPTSRRSRWALWRR
ncbi:MAG: metallophosphoesterase [Salinisphaera sp.]|nr:metallophosphoesterase [Salinisphaera sp.]